MMNKGINRAIQIIIIEVSCLYVAFGPGECMVWPHTGSVRGHGLDPERGRFSSVPRKSQTWDTDVL